MQLRGHTLQKVLSKKDGKEYSQGWMKCAFVKYRLKHSSESCQAFVTVKWTERRSQGFNILTVEYETHVNTHTFWLFGSGHFISKGEF